MQFNPAQRELTLKFVFYGPALSGKTTNLRALHAATDENARGRLMVLDTADDRTLFFDLLPLFWRTPSGVRVKIKLFTVPGQVMHNSTRRIVLSGTDAVAFIADAQPSARQTNFDYWRNMSENLRDNGMNVDEVPVVIQFNKCDLLDDAMGEEIDQMASTGKHPVFRAVAIRGEGVVETFMKLLELTYDHLDARHDLQGRLGLERQAFLDVIESTLTIPAGTP